MLYFKTGDYTDLIVANNRCFLFTGLFKREDITDKIKSVKDIGEGYKIKLKDGRKIKVVTDEFHIMWFMEDYTG